LLVVAAKTPSFPMLTFVYIHPAANQPRPV
jgi:hypothetical protein